MDQCIGKVYDELERLGLLENTIVIYTSDHGEMDGEHGLFQKNCFFDPSIRVPLMFSKPGTFPEGEAAKASVEMLELYAKLAELTDEGQAKALFGFLAEEELQHKNRVEAFYDKLVYQEF